MKKGFIIIGIAITIAAFTNLTNYRVDPAEVKAAITKSLPLLQSSSHTFLVNAGGCHSCHGQGIGAVTFSLAKEKGYAIQDTILKEALDSMHHDLIQRKDYLMQNTDPVAIVISGGYDLWAFAANNITPDKNNGLLARNILQRQLKNGSWISPNSRPPLEYYSFSATAMAVKGIQAYLPAIFQQELQQKLAAARAWMMKTKPVANEEKIFQLLGLTWAHGDAAFIKQQAQQLIAAQHTDGGWSQLATLPPDAYATGQALYALHQSGQLATEAPAYQKGIAYLLRTQKPDGSWNVQTRSFPAVTYVNSGFPHGDNQFISAAGTNWATMALLLASK